LNIELGSFQLLPVYAERAELAQKVTKKSSR
jgi:hypothetical protein